MPLCAHCKNSANLKCSSCGLVYYCSKEHQKLSWKSHKPYCIAYKIEQNDQFGRYLIANHDIKAGDIIIKKQPLVAGPKMITVPICLGCHQKLQEDFVKCSRCKWGLCSVQCENSRWHIHECILLAQTGINPDFALDVKNSKYAIILPLRALLLKTTNKSHFKQLISLQSHFEENMAKPIYTFLGRTVIPLLEKLYPRTGSAGESDADPLKICSIFDTNAYEVHNRHVNIRAVYPLVSFIAHDCTPNTRHLCDDDFAMSVIALRDIKKGEQICTTYTQTLWSTLARRAHLRNVKHFYCTCRRCADPTELGTFAGSLKCIKCQNGLLLSNHPLDRNSCWKCNNCNHSMTACQVDTLNAQIRADIIATPRTPDKFEEILANYSHLLHNTNTHALEIKYALVQLYDGTTSIKCARRCMELCQNLLMVSNILEPGCSNFKERLENCLYRAHSILLTSNVS